MRMRRLKRKTKFEPVNKIFPTITIVGLIGLAANAQNQGFTRGQLAVLRAGDGVLNLHLKQAPIFVDQFYPDAMNSAPSFTVAIPTTGSNALFFNGHAATEGNLTRSADHSLLAFAGYTGGLLKTKGTPSQLDIPRGFGTIDAAGNFNLVYGSTNWYGEANPRGVISDGTNNFWGCGNVNGVMYYRPATEPAALSGLANTRAVNIINNTLYASINGADALSADMQPGIYSFIQKDNSPFPLPNNPGAGAHLVVPTVKPHTSIVEFDLNPAGTIAYVSDTITGVQKYVQTNGGWQFAYNFAIPQVIPKELNHLNGCFGLVVDFSGAAPVIYATTMEGYGSMNSNRVVRIVDTDANAAVTTIAQANSTNIVFRGIAFTPEGHSRMTANDGEVKIAATGGAQ